MEKCFEYYACTKTDCIMHNSQSSQNCWEVEGTLCNSPELDNINGKLSDKGISKCTFCIYKKQAVSQMKFLK